jgi:adenylosuccinate lyase
MIPRYTGPEMAAIWDPQTRYRIWFEIEAHAADAMADLGIIPKAAAKAIWDKGKHAKFDIARIDAIDQRACATKARAAATSGRTGSASSASATAAA